jgi:hypothetical protein
MVEWMECYCPDRIGCIWYDGSGICRHVKDEGKI